MEHGAANEGAAVSETDKALSCFQAGALLSSAKSQIIEKWEKRCREEVPAAKSVSRLSLVNSLPDFLEQLAKTLSSPESSAQAESNAEVARLHGEERAKLGNYTLDEVIRGCEIPRGILSEHFAIPGSEKKVRGRLTNACRGIAS